VLEVTFDSAVLAGIGANELVDDDWTTCQNWADSLPNSAIIVPSAALAGTENLVLFGKRVRTPYAEEPVDPTIDTPCDPVVEVGLSPVDLLDHIRWRGHAHGGLEAWKAGAPFHVPTIAVAAWP
jgi:hypothetical protein